MLKKKVHVTTSTYNLYCAEKLSLFFGQNYFMFKTHFSAARFFDEDGRPFQGQCCHLGPEDADLDVDCRLAPVFTSYGATLINLSGCV